MNKSEAAAKGKELAEKGEAAERPGDAENSTSVDNGEEEVEVSNGMSSIGKGSAKGVAPISDYYDGLGELDAYRRTSNLYWVLSRRNGTLTLHEVDLEELECTCEDSVYNREEREPCAHFAKAILVESNMPDETREAARLREEVNIARTEIRELSNELAVSTRSTQADAVANGDDSSSPAKTKAEMSDIEKAEAWLSEHDFDTSDFDVSKHPDYGSINIETQSLSDEDFNRFKELRSDTGPMWFSQQASATIVKSEDISEVFG